MILSHTNLLCPRKMGIMKAIFSFWKKYSFIVLLAMIFASLFDFRFALAAIFCMLSPIVISFFAGRFWCGNLCPRGNFFDRVMKKIAAKREVPRLFKSIPFRLAVFAFMMTMFALGIRKNWGNLAGIGFVFYRMIVVTTLIGIVFSFIWNERSWCSFCPMGSAAALISRLRKHPSPITVTEKCISCGKCARECPMRLHPAKFKGGIVKESDCLRCGFCAGACPKNAIYMLKQSRNYSTLEPAPLVKKA